MLKGMISESKSATVVVGGGAGYKILEKQAETSK